MPRVRALSESRRRLQAKERAERERAERLLDRQEAELQTLARRATMLCRLADGKIESVARELGINPTTLRNRIRKPESFTMADVLGLERIALRVGVDWATLGGRMEEESA